MKSIIKTYLLWTDNQSDKVRIISLLLTGVILWPIGILLFTNTWFCNKWDQALAEAIAETETHP